VQARANVMHSNTYQISTSSSEYESWNWYQDYRQQMAELKSRKWEDPTRKPKDGSLPISVGRGYYAWIMRTPEVRDIIYRRFIGGDFDNDLEVKLLTSSAMYYAMSQGYSAEYCTFLSLGWGVAEGLLRGSISEEDTTAIDQRFLSHPALFEE
jgi:hypothetical protein